jgi:uncharacterized protein YdeI (BOF family)
MHNITITIKDDEGHNIETVYAKVNIPKYDAPLDVHVTNIKVTDKETIMVDVPSGATGTIAVEIDGRLYNKTISGSQVIFVLENLIAGNKTVVVRYSGDNNYTDSVVSAVFNVYKIDATIKVDIEDTKVGENVIVNVKLPKDATGVVLIDIGGVGYYANVTNGVASASIPRIPDGVYNVFVSYYGDVKYESVNQSEVVVVNKSKASFEIIDSGDGKVSIKLPSDATGKVKVNIDGTDYGEYPLIDGSCEVNIPSILAGDHTYSISYTGDSIYDGFNETGIVNIAESKLSDFDVPSLDNQNDDGTVTIKLPSDATGSITLKIGGHEYKFQVTNGTCVIKVPKDTYGEYSIIYSGDGKYPSFTTSGTLNNNVPAPNNNVPTPDNNVAKTTLTLKTIKVLKKSAKKLKLTATLKIKGKATKGKKVTFIFRGKKFKAKTNAKGIAKVTIKRAKLRKLLKKVKLGKKSSLQSKIW